jgi:hypothetical protein
MSYPVESLPSGWANVWVTPQDPAKGARIEIVHLESGNFYLHEPMQITANKCLALFLIGLPLYFFLYTTYHMIRLPLATLWNLDFPFLAKQIGNLVSIPFYWIAMEAAALYGVFYPLEGRALFAQIESSLHDGKKRSDSEQYLGSRNSPVESLGESFFSTQDRPPLFIAFCFQPYENNEEWIKDRAILPNPIPQFA